MARKFFFCFFFVFFESRRELDVEFVIVLRDYTENAGMIFF